MMKKSFDDRIGTGWRHGSAQSREGTRARSPEKTERAGGKTEVDRTSASNHHAAEHATTQPAAYRSVKLRPRISHFGTKSRENVRDEILGVFTSRGEPDEPRRYRVTPLRTPIHRTVQPAETCCRDEQPAAPY